MKATPVPQVDKPKRHAKSRPQTSKKETALREIAMILEDQMTEMGLSESEKNAKTVQLVEVVGNAVSERLSQPAKPSWPDQIVANRA